MIEEVRKQEKDKQRLLWGSLAVLSLPAVPLLLNDAIADAAKSLWRKVKYIAEDHFGYVPKSSPPINDQLYLKPDTPLYKWTENVAKEQGVALGEVSINPNDQGKPVTGASVSFFKGKAFITFSGDPTADDPAITKAIIAHELGHSTAGDRLRFSKIAMTTTSAYALMAQAAFSTGILVQGIQSLPFLQNAASNDLNPLSAAMLGLGAASLAAIRVTSSLTRKFNHSVEFLSDLTGSKIVGPQDMVSMLGEISDRNEKELKEFKRIQDDETKIEWSKMSVRDVWSMAIHQLRKPMTDTHPECGVRQDFIRNAHDMTQRTQQVIAPKGPDAKDNSIGKIFPV